MKVKAETAANGELCLEEIDRLIATGDYTALHLSEIGRFPRLSRQEEIALGKRLLKKDRQAQHLLVLHNMRLVIAEARKNHSPLEFPDRIQEGYLGLIRAVNKYDWRRGKFSTHATWWIRQAITRAAENKDRPIRLSSFSRHLGNKVAQAEQRLASSATPPTNQEIAAEILRTAKKPLSDWMQNVSAQAVGRLRQRQQATEVVYLEEHPQSPPTQEPDVASQAINRLSLNEIPAMLEKAKLTPRELTVLVLRNGLETGESARQKDVAAQMKVTVVTVHTWERMALAKIQAAAADTDANPESTIKTP